ncbi:MULTISPECIES: neuraminidase-like domain-containing protein [unclassified Sinorhizobium]|uniref:Tc toxin subunit A-related protein n=1 Tax=unclassified Sinorhizobium TaxID=2613772 RepID=UPI0024C24E3C|nr:MULTISPECIES: neuraminidase-like domain-containing protein [unclassified Sinorhizobium]MDK1377243.1 neuraminidase-like domain-containing protein [Sinorhizobium sp. 6-70]MDK1478791.1 neuraminidase-like domain-containing protein [Sinorhizobium sp. 6-117]
MKVVLPIFTPSTAEKEHVSRLHEALKFLLANGGGLMRRPKGQDATDFKAEVAAERYGRVTKDLIFQFQQNKNLQKSTTLDKTTANEINVVLHAERQISKISGQIGSFQQDKFTPSSLIGIKVVARLEEAGAADVDVSVASSRIDGKFDLYTDGEYSGSTVFLYAFVRDARVYAHDIDVTRPRVQWAQFGSEQETSLGVDTAKVPIVEFPEVRKEVKARIQVAKLDNSLWEHPDRITPADIKIIIKQNPQSSFPLLTEQQLEYFVVAHWLAKDALNGEIFDAQFVYGILRLEALLYAQLGQDVEQIKDQGRKIRPRAQLNIFPDRSFVDKYLAQIAFYSDVPPKSGPSDEVALFEVIKSAIDSRIIEPGFGDSPPYLNENYSALNGLYKERLVNLRDYFYDVKEEYVPSIPFHVRLDFDCYCAERGVHVSSQIDFALLAQTDKLPQSYADLSLKVVQSQKLKSGPRHFQASATRTSIDRLIKDIGLDSAEASKLRAIGRVSSLTQEHKEIAFLLGHVPEADANLDGAWKIRMLGRGRFTKAYVRALGGEGKESGLLGRKAATLYQRAAARAEITAHIFSEARALATAQYVDALCSPHDRNRIATAFLKGRDENLPSWESLFGSLDACACDDCQSIYGPASYLVDVLQFFKRLDCIDVDGGDQNREDARSYRPCLAGPKEAKTVFDILISRRPDIAYLDLNCANAMTPVPYIDLVNELLEDFVAETPLKLRLKLEPGPIPEIALTALQDNGFLAVTAKAEVTADSLGNRLVRDDRTLLLFEHQGEEAKCPIWLVRELRQTYGSEEEIGAAPEFVNQAAARVLRSSHLNLALPYDGNRAEALSYLAKMDLDRAEVIRDLATWRDHIEPSTSFTGIVSAEMLGLTAVERDIIVTPDPRRQHEYWAEAQWDVVVKMSELRRFLDKTELKTEPVGTSEFDELLGGAFINPSGNTLIVVSDEPDNPATQCDTNKMHIRGLDEEALDRINRLLRLQKKVGWPINLLDRLIMSPAIGHGKLNKTCIAALADLVCLASRWDMDVQALATWFADVSTFGGHSDYGRIFLQKDDNGYPYEPFKVENLCPPVRKGPEVIVGESIDADQDDCPLLRDHKEHLAKALGVPTDQLNAWLDFCSNEPGSQSPVRLSLRNLSRVWAWFRLTKKLGLKMRELVTLLTMLDIKDALASPGVTARVRDAVNLMKKWNLSVADVRFWLLHKVQDVEEERTRIISDLSISKLLNDIRTSFRAVREARAAKEITDDAMAGCLAKLTSALSQVPELTAGEVQRLANLLQNRSSSEEVQEFAGLLTGAPLGSIAGVAEHASRKPVNEIGSWTETSEDPKKVNHTEYLAWTSFFLDCLLDYLDQAERDLAVLRLTSQHLKAPIEQIETILRWCRMPKDDRPAAGGSIIETLSSASWSTSPISNDVETAKLIKGMWNGIFCAAQGCIDTLDEKPRKFREAVVANTPITTWDEPPEMAAVEKWRSLLSPLFIGIRLTHKVLGLMQKLNVQTDHLLWGLWRELPEDGSPNRFQRLGWFSPDQVPLTKSADASELGDLYHRWVMLLEGLDFLIRYPLTEIANDPNVKLGGATALELALSPAPSDATGDPSTGLDSIRDILAICDDLFDLPHTEVVAIAGWLEIPRAGFKDAATYRYLLQACNVVRKLEFPIASLPALVADVVTRDLVLVLRQCLKQQSDPTTWLETLKQVQDPLREQRRDALVAYLIADPNHGCFHKINDLYDHFLIDTQMCACMPTSRIVQAHAVVQLFAQRCLMGQEPSVNPSANESADDPNSWNEWNEWRWMRNYRVWEANRKIFLYPENWIEPELRDDKSQFFKGFEQSLAQAEVTDSNVVLAAQTYLDKLDDAAFMEVMAIHYQHSDFAESGRVEGPVLHVVARTKGGDPATYFYRRFLAESDWTPWESIDLDIATDHLLLFVRNGRLNIAWPVFTDVIDESAELEVPTAGQGNQGKRQIPTAPRGWTIQLALSERSNGAWQPKRVSKDVIRTSMVDTTTERMMSERRRCRFVIRDTDAAQTKMADDNVNQGFFILAFGFIRPTAANKLDHPDVKSEPLLMGAFNLAGCKGYPEVVAAKKLSKFSSATGVTVPRIEDTIFESQRWGEQYSDSNDSLSVQGLLANHFHRTAVLGTTPGTFKVTTAQQTTVVDNVIMGILRILKEDPRQWQPSGVFLPFFYEDGRRAYVAVPTLRESKDVRDNITISDLAKNLSMLSSDIEAAVKRTEETWEDLVHMWSKLPKDDARRLAYNELTGQLRGCFGVSFTAFYHPFVCFMKQCLAEGGFERLMNSSSLSWRNKRDEFVQLYKPDSVVLRPYPTETKEFQFEVGDGYASYNWEVFYHLPSMVGHKLVVDQKFEDALRWYHFIFNPTGVPDSRRTYGEDVEQQSAAQGAGRYWVTKPFRLRTDQPSDSESYVGQRIETILAILAKPDDHSEAWKRWHDAVVQWQRNPFVPHLVARGRTVAFQKTTVMRYLDAVIQWGDFLFRQDTRESVNEALQLYITAERLLGTRPRVVEAPKGSRPSRTYRELELVMYRELADDRSSLVELENTLPGQLSIPDVGRPSIPALPAGCLLATPYFCVPRNEKLMGYWDTVDDRLYKIRHCQNIEGVERQLALFAPPIDPALLVRAFAAGLSIGDVLAQGAGEVPHYRFQVMIEKAFNLVQMVINLGNSLLQAIEKRDAEALAQLRSSHEIGLLKLIRDIKVRQIEEALQTLAGLKQTRAAIEERYRFYQSIEYMTSAEQRSLDLNEEGMRLETTALVFNTAASVAHMLPDFTIGGWGFGGAPGTDLAWGGVNIANAASAMGQFVGESGSLKRSAASAVGVQASYERRWNEWKLQERVAAKELSQVDRQILAAETRIEIFKSELRSHDKQQEQAADILAYMTDRKFSNQELYNWMIGEISASYYQAWQMAHRFALRVERAFHFELGPKGDGFTANSYVRPDSWNGIRNGLLAGERLMLDLKRMEVDYLERNCREFEITKHISLVRLDPDAFLDLKRSGRCSVELPDWLFDMDYPGHYFRRIKSVSLSIPCVAGPYASVNCTLTLTKNRIRIKPMQSVDDDEPNLLTNFAHIQSIATSAAQNDSGMFEVNFRDERYLPFEGAGVLSSWMLELPKEDNRQLDFDSITDVIVHLKYTARQGGKKLQENRRKAVSNYFELGYPINDPKPIVHRLFYLEDEFPSQWHRFQALKNADGKHVLALEGLEDRLPYLLREIPSAAARVRIVSLTETSLQPTFDLNDYTPESKNQWQDVVFGEWKFAAEEAPDNLGLLVSINLKALEDEPS